MKKHLLFVCSSNIDRSVAAASLFDDNDKYEAKSCGILPHAEVKVSGQLIKWADIIFCMEHEHKAFLRDNFKDALDKEVAVLNMPRSYVRNDWELKRILRGKLSRFFEGK
jgi:predicted protein tyrosine phosphatase